MKVNVFQDEYMRVFKALTRTIAGVRLPGFPMLDRPGLQMRYIGYTLVINLSFLKMM